MIAGNELIQQVTPPLIEPDMKRLNEIFMTLSACMLIAINVASAASSSEKVRTFEITPGKNAASWQLGPDVTVELDDTGSGYAIRCGAADAATATRALLAGIPVKPSTGYILRCRVNSVIGNTQFTFAALTKANDEFNPEDYYDEHIAGLTRDLFQVGLAFYASRDEFLCGAPGWEQVDLPFRTAADQHEMGIYLGRRYGAQPVFYDSIALIEDDSVAVGEIVPEVNPLPELTTAEREQGFIVSSQSWMRPVFPGYIPRPEELTSTVACRLAPDEYEPATISLTGLRTLNNVALVLDGDLVNDGGERLGADSVDIGIVRFITRWLTNAAPVSPGQRFERRPLFIFPNEKVRIDANHTQTWWLTIHAPPEQTPGTYRGKLIASADGTADLPIELAIEILPIKLLDPDITYGMYYRHTEQPADLKTEEFYLQSARDMKAHGMNSMSVYTQVERQDEDGRWVVDLDNEANGFYSLRRQMRMLAEAGLAHADHPLLFLPSHGGADGLRDNALALPVLGRLLQDQGWPELLLYLYDEVGAKPELWPTLDAEMREIAAIKEVHPEATRIRLTTAAPGEKSHYYDVIIRGEPQPGKELWTYNCSWNGSLPINDRFFAGLHTWREGLRGNWQWCYTESRELKLTEDGEIDLGKIGAYADPWSVNYVLPSTNGNIPTMGWEGRREGIDDYRYLHTLEHAIAAAEQSEDASMRELARQASAFLDGVKHAAQVPASATPASQINSVRPYSVLMHPDLSFEYYDRVRRTTADWIIRLNH